MKRLMISDEKKPHRWWLIIGIAALIIAFAAGSWLLATHGRRAPADESRTSSSVSRLYVCPMHPSYTSDSPGECPICGMTLVPMESQTREEQKHEHEPSTHAPVTVTKTQQQMIGVKTAPVEMRTLTRKIRTVGTVAYDPDLAVAQREFIEAVKLGDRSLASAATKRLELLGMSGGQIEELRKSRRVQKNLYLPAPQGKVWIYGVIYESDIPYVTEGQAMQITLPDKAAPAFDGSIVAISPVLDSKTRSTRIRSEVADPQGLLKPNLYVNVLIDVPLGEGLSIPSNALMWSEGAYHVFVDEGNGRLVPRKVEVGRRTREFAQIQGGLAQGEKVVTSPNFLIDAESQIKATLQSMKGQGEEKKMEGHQHVH